MPISKTQVIETIQAMPQDEVKHIDEVFEELILLEKIKRGLKDMKEGHVISEEELDKQIEQW